MPATPRADRRARRPRRGLLLGAVQAVPVVPHVGREPGELGERPVGQIAPQRGLVLDVRPAPTIALDGGERRERVVLDDVRVLVGGDEAHLPRRVLGDVAVHVRPPAQRAGRLLDQVDEGALGQRRRRVVAGDVAQLARQRGDVVGLRWVHDAEAVHHVDPPAGQAAHVGIGHHVAPVLVLEHDHEHVIEEAARVAHRAILTRSPGVAGHRKRPARADARSIDWIRGGGSSMSDPRTARREARTARGRRWMQGSPPQLAPSTPGT